MHKRSKWTLITPLNNLLVSDTARYAYKLHNPSQESGRVLCRAWARQLAGRASFSVMAEGSKSVETPSKSYQRLKNENSNSKAERTIGLQHPKDRHERGRHNNGLQPVVGEY